MSSWSPFFPCSFHVASVCKNLKQASSQIFTLNKSCIYFKTMLWFPYNFTIYYWWKQICILTSWVCLLSFTESVKSQLGLWSVGYRVSTVLFRVDEYFDFWGLCAENAAFHKYIVQDGRNAFQDIFKFPSQNLLPISCATLVGNSSVLWRGRDWGWVL